MAFIERTETPELDATGNLIAVNGRAVFECRDAVLFTNWSEVSDEMEESAVATLTHHVRRAALQGSKPATGFDRHTVGDKTTIREGVLRVIIRWRDSADECYPVAPDVFKVPDAVTTQGLALMESGNW